MHRKAIYEMGNAGAHATGGAAGGDNHPKRKQSASDSPRTTRRPCADKGLNSCVSADGAINNPIEAIGTDA